MQCHSLRKTSFYLFVFTCFLKIRKLHQYKFGIEGAVSKPSRPWMAWWSYTDVFMRFRNSVLKSKRPTKSHPPNYLNGSGLGVLSPDGGNNGNIICGRSPVSVLRNATILPISSSLYSRPNCKRPIISTASSRVAASPS